MAGSVYSVRHRLAREHMRERLLALRVRRGGDRVIGVKAADRLCREAAALADVPWEPLANRVLMARTGNALSQRLFRNYFDKHLFKLADVISDCALGLRVQFCEYRARRRLQADEALTCRVDFAHEVIFRFATTPE